MSKLQEIYNGWKNLIIPDEEMKPLIEEVYNKRESICIKCPYASENVKAPNLSSQIRFDSHCTLCGCTRAAKNRSLASECPDNPKRWEKEVNDINI